MCFAENQEDRISIVQMNSELRHAELELLSAHCATHKLRLRFSAKTVARHGRRDVLRKSIETASAERILFVDRKADAGRGNGLRARYRIGRRFEQRADPAGG